jgi:hypothetical protein
MIGQIIEQPLTQSIGMTSIDQSGHTSILERWLVTLGMDVLGRQLKQA